MNLKNKLSNEISTAMIAKLAKYHIQALLAKFRFRLVPLGRLAANEGVFPSLKYLVKDQKDAVIFDVGAHRGETALAFREWFPEARIFSFEPFGASYDILSKVAHADSNIHALRFGLGDKREMKKFYSNAVAATNSLLPTNPVASKIYEPGIFETREVVQAEFRTADDFAAEYHIGSIDILKLDVQGAEHLVMKGADKLLKSGAIRVISAEIIARQTYEGQLDVVDTLRTYYDAGFTLYNTYNPSLARDGSLRQFDAIFTRKG
jgi:FkbM family methyltransferase